MKAWPDLDSTAAPPLDLTISMVFQVKRRVVHDFAAGLAAQQYRGQQPDDVVALDEAALLIEQKAAVEVPVPGDAEIRAVGANRRHSRLAILLEHGIRDAVRESGRRAGGES